jgi:SAM-dependent methyltransferase
VTSAERWGAELAAWAIDPQILAAAPESPYALPPELFRASARGDGSVSRDVALSALPPGGTVLDVGCGAGAASLALVPPAAALIAVDEQPGMLAAFAATARERDVRVTTVQGRWPETAQAVPPADVVVCHHVLYNVADLPPFVAALTAHARRRVVVELTAAHPWAGIGPLWQRAHGQERPEGPMADLAAQVVREIGLDVQVKTSVRDGRSAPRDETVALMRRRLCLPVDREPEVAEWMRELGMDRLAQRAIVTLWWDGFGEWVPERR